MVRIWKFNITSCDSNLLLLNKCICSWVFPRIHILTHLFHPTQDVKPPASCCITLHPPTAFGLARCPWKLCFISTGIFKTELDTKTLRCISNEGGGDEEVNVFYERGGPHGLGRAAVPSGLLCLAPSTWPGQESNPPLTQLLASSLSHTQLLAGPGQQDADPHTQTHVRTQDSLYWLHPVHKPNLKRIFIFNAKLKPEPDINNKWQNMTVSTFKLCQLLKK